MMKTAIQRVAMRLRCTRKRTITTTRTRTRPFCSSFSTSASPGQHNDNDPICELAASNLRFGPGATAEVGMDLRDALGAQKVVVFTDPNVKQLDCMQVLLESLERSQISSVSVYDQVRVEPNEVSFQHAIDFLQDTVHNDYDAVIALGGGSVIDTAKAANLYACFPPGGDFYDYVNPPVGKGLPVPAGILKPLIAIPTTAGTGSETTGVAIFDDTATSSKTGIANRRLKPTLGIIDPNNTISLPKEVATYSGLDVLCHAMESYTALPFHQRPRPLSPIHRPAYQGSNPISDVWSLFALETAAKYLPIVVKAPDNEHARAKMLLASSAAGMGFGNAGVHLCHGMSYPVASQVKSYQPNHGYEGVDHAIVPHGLSVIVNAPAVFRFTGIADPERHKRCAQMLYTARCPQESLIQQVSDEDAGRWLADEILELAYLLDVPMGLRNLGYTEDDIPQLVQGTLPQHRVTKISPRPVGEKELEALFLDALDAPSTPGTLKSLNASSSTTANRAPTQKPLNRAAMQRRAFSSSTSSEPPPISANVVQGPSLLQTSVPRSAPSLMFLPGLRSLPFWTRYDETSASTQIAYQDSTLTKVLEHLEGNADVLREEYYRVAPELKSDYKYDAANEHSLHKGTWDWHSYMTKGAIQGQFGQYFPETTKVLQALRTQNTSDNDNTGLPSWLLLEDVPFGYGFFSTLHPHSSIDAHTSPMNLRWRIHLALDVPKDSTQEDPKTGLPLCGIRVGNQVQCWTEGKALVLDDSYEHEVWNHTDEKRVIFLLDLWHPDVSLKERKDIVGMFQHAQEQGWYSKTK